MQVLEPSDPTAAAGRAAPSGIKPWKIDPAAVYCLLVIVAAAPYLNTLLNGFVYDDNQQILANPFIQNARYLKQLFTSDVWAFMGPTLHSGYYRPLMSLTFFVFWKLYGAVPLGYHIGNVVLESLIVCTLFAVTKRWINDELAAFATAAIFALHPIHSEAVAWIADITDLEATLFLLLSFWFYLGLAKTEGNSRIQFAGMIACFAAALFSKESAIVFPVLLTFFAFGFQSENDRDDMREKLRRIVAIWATAVVYMVIRTICMGKITAADTRRTVSLKETALTGFSLVEHYAAKLVWPNNLCAFYVFPHPTRILDASVLVGALIVMAFAYLVVTLRKSQPILAFGLLWLGVPLSLSLNVHWLGTTDFAERYLYLPSVGFAWIGGILVSWLWTSSWVQPRVARCLLAAIAGMLAIVCTGEIITRNRDWRNDQSLYTRTLEQQPHAAKIRVSLGVLYWGQGDLAFAEHEWREALTDSPSDGMALTDMAMALIRKGDLADAEADLNQAIRVAPKLAAAYIWLGHLREKQNRLDLAETAYRRAVELAPLQVATRQELGDFYLSQGRLTEAADQFRVGAEDVPNFLFWDQLGRIYVELGRIGDARQAFQSALDINPLDGEAHANLGMIYEQNGDHIHARLEYEACIGTEPNNPIARAGLTRLKDSNR